MLFLKYSRLLGLSNGRNNFFLGFICFVYIVGIVIACLWPFNLNPTNKVKWFNEGDGITFSDQSVVFSREPLAMPRPSSNREALTIELIIQPHQENPFFVASLLTLYDHDIDYFIIGQWKNELIIRVNSNKLPGPGNYRELSVENVLLKYTTHFITIVSSNDTTAVYVDGFLKKKISHFSLISYGSRLSGHLVLGNSPECTQPWIGTIHRFAIYSRSLGNDEVIEHYCEWQVHTRGMNLYHVGASNHISSRMFSSRFFPFLSDTIALYLFNEHSGNLIIDHSGNHNDLLIPSNFHCIRNIILGLPAKEHWFRYSNLTDIVINIFGFVPLGFLLSSCLHHRVRLSAFDAAVLTVVFAFCLSLSVEVIQAYIPTRDSSLLDIFSNTLGSVVGVLLFKINDSKSFLTG